MNTVLLPLVLLSLAWFLPAASSRQADPRGRVCAAVLTVLLVALYAVDPPHRAPLYQPRPPSDFRQNTQAIAQRLVARLGEEHSLFVYFPKSHKSVERSSPAFRGAHKAHMLKYQLTPIPTTINTRLIDEPALREALKHDYLWIFANESELGADFHAAFRATFGGATPKANAIYRVKRNPDEVVRIPLSRLVKRRTR